MTTPRLLGHVLLPIVLLVASRCIRDDRAWSADAEPTFVWLCSALAVALTVVGATALLAHDPAGRIPRRAALLTAVVVIGVAGVGLVVDNWAGLGEPRFRIAVAEWIGFAVILGALFRVQVAPATDSAR
jgi:uncharacterized membrane protein YdcZ (DUF606 family)